MHRRLSVAAFAAVALAAAAAPMASAVEPTRADWEESFSEVVDLMCPFPVVTGGTLAFHEVYFYDQDGDMVRLGQHVIAQSWVTANGKTAVSDRRVINTTILFDPDYGQTYLIWRVGPERYRLPDGTWYTLTGAGITSYDFTSDTLKVTPGIDNQYEDIDILCEALA